MSTYRSEGFPRTGYLIPGCDGDLGLDWLGNSSRRAAVAAAVVAPGLGWNAWAGMPKSRLSGFYKSRVSGFYKSLFSGGEQDPSKINQKSSKNEKEVCLLFVGAINFFGHEIENSFSKKFLNPDFL